MAMKKRKQVTKGRKIARLQAAAGRATLPLELTEKWSGYYRPIKKPITLRLDADVLAWFQKLGRGYQTRINQALRKVMTAERKKSGE
ncbi:MAG: BrnA antitoxin family protein [Terriglobales bacterium]